MGGNSLWPAPEGGAFAFNYLPGSDAWVVQDGIAKAVPSVRRDGDDRAIVEKPISLTNRKSAHVSLVYRREISVLNTESLLQGYEIEGMGYATDDILEPIGHYSPDDVLLAPWSLEQFPGAEGVVAFGKIDGDGNALNRDFYGDPGDRIVLGEGQFTFQLGGKDRHQIGIKVCSRPCLIGALDTRRSLLLLRRTEVREGLYFNIADNDQIDGPFSTEDLYSIFNGGELGFFELETIGAMHVENGRVAASSLPSQTIILKGSTIELLRYLSERHGVNLSEPLATADSVASIHS
jgi:hypothetical protein